MAHKGETCKKKINKVESTDETLTDRGGIALFVRYLTSIGIYALLEKYFGKLRKSRKGGAIPNIFKQLFCYFFDGTKFSLKRFDELQRDDGYIQVIENDAESMCSSHGIKRFFKAFSYVRIWLFRRLLQKLFIWRLNVEKPEVIILGADVMVMDNDEAEKRHGVKPTYKGVKGFAPLQLNWGPYIVDAVLRGGSKHSNDGDTTAEMVEHAAKRIRKEYREDVPIVVRLDSGFFDQKNFDRFEKLGIGYACGGKMYEDIKTYVSAAPEESFGRYSNDHQEWDWMEFGNCRGNWKKFRRTIYCRPYYSDRQMLFEFCRPDTVIVTNLGMGGKIDESLEAAGKNTFLQPEGIIELYHGRGNDELVNEALKNFGTERLPFTRFSPNAAFYYTMLVAFFLFEAFKRDVTAPVIKVTSYAETVRRTLVDIAGKFVYKSNQITLKVTRAVWKRLKVKLLWKRSNSPPALSRAA